MLKATLCTLSCQKLWEMFVRLFYYYKCSRNQIQRLKEALHIKWSKPSLNQQNLHANLNLCHSSFVICVHYFSYSILYHCLFLRTVCTYYSIIRYLYLTILRLQNSSKSFYIYIIYFRRSWHFKILYYLL